MLPNEIERRLKPRVEGPISAMVYGQVLSGEPFQILTALDNLSVSGLHLRLRRPVAVASPLHAIIRIAGIKVNVKGVVRRIEMEPDGSFGLAVAFEGYRVVPDPTQASDKRRSPL